MHLSSYSLIFTIMQPILSSFIILTTFNKRDIHHLLLLSNGSHYEGWLTLVSTYCGHMSKRNDRPKKKHKGFNMGVRFHRQSASLVNIL